MNKTEEAIFRAEFKGGNLVRFSDLTINWMTCPQYLSIEIAREPGVYFKLIEEK
jgi:hypothetical protein